MQNSEQVAAQHHASNNEVARTGTTDIASTEMNKWFLQPIEALIPVPPHPYTAKQEQVYNTLMDMIKYRHALAQEGKAKKHHIAELAALLYAINRLKFKLPKALSIASGDTSKARTAEAESNTEAKTSV